MLAPMDIEPVQKSIKTFYLNICAADRVAYTAKSTNIFPLPNEFPWIAKVRSDLKVLSGAGDLWYTSKAGIISGAAASFINYSNLFTAIEDVFINAGSASVIVAILNRLIDSVNENISAVRTARLNFEECREQTLVNIDPINDSINSGWRQLAASEKKVTELAQAIALAEASILKSEDASSLSSLSSIPVSGYADICAGTVKIVSSMVIDGLAIPYLSVGMLLFSFGKTIHDIVANAKSLEAENATLSQYALGLSMEEKALAQTKVLLQLLYGIKETIASQGNALDQIETFWKNEKRNLMTVREKFSDGAIPFEKDNAEALQIPIGNVVWRTLGNTARDLLAWINKPLIAGNARVALTI